MLGRTIEAPRATTPYATVRTITCSSITTYSVEESAGRPQIGPGTAEDRPKLLLDLADAHVSSRTCVRAVWDLNQGYRPFSAVRSASTATRPSSAPSNASLTHTGYRWRRSDSSGC